MDASDRCDLAIWAYGTTLTGAARARLQRPTRRDGPKLAVTVGDWGARRVAIGWPQRTIARHAPTTREALAALVAAHQPRLLVLMGPVASRDPDLAPDSVVIAETVNFLDGALAVPAPAGVASIGLPRAAFASEQGASGDVVTDWAAVAAHALDDSKTEGVLLGGVTQASVSAGALLKPPASRRRTLAREAGAFLGRLVNGKQEPPSASAKLREAVADAIDSILATL